MLELINRGGWALWIITLCSIISLAVTLERWITLRKADIDSDDLLDRVSKALDQGDLEGATAMCESTAGPVAETLAIGLKKLIFLEEVGKRPEEIEQGIVQAMEDHGVHVMSFLERNLTVLATTASLAPILGMMGTVVGMIRAFLSSAQANTMTPAVVSRGIGEALLCTAGGLIVAALATVEYNYFTTRVNHFILRVQTAGTKLVERVLNAQRKGLWTKMAEGRATQKEPLVSAEV